VRSTAAPVTTNFELSAGDSVTGLIKHAVVSPLKVIHVIQTTNWLQIIALLCNRRERKRRPQPGLELVPGREPFKMLVVEKVK
jgi:hypothetical protein